MSSKSVSLSAFILFFTCLLLQGQSNLVGKSVFNLQLQDSKDKPAMIPFLGEKVVTLFYTDPDVGDINDPLSDALKSKKFSDDKYKGMGIVNCKDTWLPNSAIRMAVAKKEKKYPGAIILMDKSGLVSKNWNLGECDDYAVVIIVGKDKKIKYAKSIKTAAESQAMINPVINIIEQEITK
jgi:predicted transcriptional regulator